MSDRELIVALIQSDWVAEWIRGDKKDRFEYACDVAKEHGRDEPTTDDEVEGLKRMIHAAIEREESADAK